MKRLFRFKSIYTKILFGFSAVLILCLVLGGFSFLYSFYVNQRLETVSTEYMPQLSSTQSIARNMSERAALLQMYVLSDNETYRELFVNGTDDSIALENRVLRINNSEEIRELINRKAEWGALLLFLPLEPSPNLSV